VVKLEPVELVFEATHCIAVHLHLLVMVASLLHHLVDDELGVSPNVETFDAECDGDAEAVRPGAARLLTGIECSRVRDSS